MDKIISAYAISRDGVLVYSGLPVEQPAPGLSYEDHQDDCESQFKRSNYKYEVYGIGIYQHEDTQESNKTYLMHQVRGILPKGGVWTKEVFNKRLYIRHVLEGDTFRARDFWRV